MPSRSVLMLSAGFVSSTDSQFDRAVPGIRILCLLLLLAGIAMYPAAAAEDDVVFRSDVSLVRVDTQVVDRDNRAITGLRAEDFILREQGRLQPIRNFVSEKIPVDVVLLLDVSASMRPHIERIASAAHEAFRALRDEDRIAIMVFDRSTRLRLSFRKSHDDAERELESLLNQETFNGGTDITRGLLDAADYVARQGRREARRAIVIVTDDQTGSNRDVEGVSRALTKADAVLSLLLAPDAMANRAGMGGGRRGGGGGGWPGGGGGMGGPLGGIILGRRGGGGPYGGRGPGGTRGPRTQSAGTAEIAHRSGGDSLPVDAASALETTLARIRQRYALHFNLPDGVKPGEERAIDVSLADAARQRYPRAELRYRRVYLAPTLMAGAGSAGPAPALINRLPVEASGGGTPAPEVRQVPVARRRMAVDRDESREGPLSGPIAAPEADTKADAPAPSQSGSRHVDQPSQRSGPIVTETNDQKPRCGGWHRADEPAPPPCPSTTATTDTHQPPQSH
jgi:VWFA-related protein